MTLAMTLKVDCFAVLDLQAAQNTRRSLAELDNIITMTPTLRAKCAQYYLALRLHLPIASSDMLKYAFTNLSTFENETKAYEKFIDSFSTHISYKSRDARGQVCSEFEQQAWGNMKQSGLNTALATQLSFGLLATFNDSTETKSDRMLTQNSES